MEAPKVVDTGRRWPETRSDKVVFAFFILITWGGLAAALLLVFLH